MRTEEKQNGTLEHWTPEEVADALERNAIVLIDVRTPQEYMLEHVEGALLAPMAFLDPQKLPSQDGRDIVFHCGSGARSCKVAEMYLKERAEKAAHMEGGFGAWKKAGLAYMGTDMASGAPKRISNGKD